MGDSGQRFSQPPSKVLHIRNLPYETTHEELCELAAPFGEVVQSKLNVGPNRNQAFIEFAEQAPAIQMCNYFNGSADPAKVRGKTVYLQYSNRNEIVNARNAGETPSNVLLVSLENIMPDVPLTLEVLHLVFSAFGFVHKIAIFEKGSGLQALVQYTDIPTAEQVRQALDGRHIPKNLLRDTPYPPLLKIAFSQHTDLNVRVQSHRSRDYTANGAYLPVSGNLSDPITAGGAPIGMGDPSESNILLVQIENMAYPITVDALHTVFSPYGTIQKIAIFEKGGNTQALVQYPEGSMAANAMAALEGHAIYDGGYNKLKLAYSRHHDLNVRANNDRSWDYTGAMGAAGSQGSAPRGAPAPAATYAGPGAEQLQGGGGGGLAPHEPGPTGAEYEAAHIAVAKGAEIALRNRPAGTPQYGGAGPHYGAPPGQPGVYSAPPQGYAPPPPGPGGYAGGPPPGPGQYGPPRGYPGPPPPGQYGQPPPGAYPGPPGSGPPPYPPQPGYGPPPSNGAPYRPPPSQYGGPPGPPGRY